MCGLANTQCSWEQVPAPPGYSRNGRIMNERICKIYLTSFQQRMMQYLYGSQFNYYGCKMANDAIHVDYEQRGYTYILVSETLTVEHSPCNRFFQCTTPKMEHGTAKIL